MKDLKFSNLLHPLSSCKVGDIVRIKGSGLVATILEMRNDVVYCVLQGYQGRLGYASDTKVNRQLLKK